MKVRVSDGQFEVRKVESPAKRDGAKGAHKK
jgi:hypothetical protein